MKHEVSLTCSQEPATCLYPDPRWIQSTPSQTIPLRSVSILSSPTHLGLTRCLFLSALQSPVCIATHPHTCHMIGPSCPPDFLILIKFDKKMQIRKLFTMQFSPAYQFLPFKSQYSPQHTIGRLTPRLTNRIRSEHMVVSPIGRLVEHTTWDGIYTLRHVDGDSCK